MRAKLLISRRRESEDAHKKLFELNNKLMQELAKKKEVADDLQSQLNNVAKFHHQAYGDQIKNLKEQVEQLDFEATQCVQDDLNKQTFFTTVSTSKPLQTVIQGVVVPPSL